MSSGDPGQGTVEDGQLANGSGEHAALAPSDADPAVVGIDFGVRRTLVSSLADGCPVVLPWPNGLLTGPSLVHFPNSREVRVASAAEPVFYQDPDHVVAPRRLFGHRAPAAWEVPATRHDDDGFIEVDAWGQWVPVTVLGACVLAAARRAARAALGRPIGSAVFTVPYGFGAAEEGQLLSAAQLARIDVQAIVHEPDAVALALAYVGEHGTVLIVDLNASRCTVSLVALDGPNARVLAAATDENLGEDAYDLCLAEAVSSLPRHPLDRGSWHRLLATCATVRVELGDAEHASLCVSEAYGEDTALYVTVDRASFGEVTEPLLAGSVELCWSVIASAPPATPIQAALLVGRGAPVALLAQRLSETAGLATRLAPLEEPAVLGAALLGSSTNSPRAP